MLRCWLVVAAAVRANETSQRRRGRTPVHQWRASQREGRASDRSPTSGKRHAGRTRRPRQRGMAKSLKRPSDRHAAPLTHALPSSSHPKPRPWKARAPRLGSAYVSAAPPRGRPRTPPPSPTCPSPCARPIGRPRLLKPHGPGRAPSAPSRAIDPSSQSTHHAP